MKLVAEAGKWHKLWSVRLGLLALVLGGLEKYLPSLGDYLPEWIMGPLTMVVGAAAIIARFIPQEAIRAYVADIYSQGDSDGNS
ncbi:DUF7940 domain-containing protein [Phytohalomonas tamaricis]|uniref:DUF7940 domain-containing protein n=1 Tax=Phytohalomonas tamaricis TaxID=2081032 RepID=UPI000D0B74C2|nr:hypothetical protein [Phytohalomonas tamaricis]